MTLELPAGFSQSVTPCGAKLFDYCIDTYIDCQHRTWRCPSMAYECQTMIISSNPSVSSRSRSVIPTRARRRLSDALSDSHVSQKTTSPNNTETARRSGSHDASDPPCCTGTHDIRGRSHSSYTSRDPEPSLSKITVLLHMWRDSGLLLRTPLPVIILSPSEDSRKTTDPASDASIAQAATEHRNPVCK